MPVKNNNLSSISVSVRFKASLAELEHVPAQVDGAVHSGTALDDSREEVSGGGKEGIFSASTRDV